MTNKQRPVVPPQLIGSKPAESASMTTFLSATPHIHIHYHTSDAQMAELGWGEAELACHNCATGLTLKYPASPPADQIDDEGWSLLRNERELFVKEHGEHRGLYSQAGHALCPPARNRTSTRDLRGN